MTSTERKPPSGCRQLEPDDQLRRHYWTALVVVLASLLMGAQGLNSQLLAAEADRAVAHWVVELGGSVELDWSSRQAESILCFACG